MNKEDLLLAKTQADITAEARKMLDPSIGREDIDLANFKPIPLPNPVYQDPMKPKIPPPPIKGAMPQAPGFADMLPGAALSGIATFAAVGGPLGVGLGIATGLLSLF